MTSIYNLMQVLAAKTDVYIDGWRPWTAPTKLEHNCLRSTNDKSGQNMESKNKREDTPAPSVIPAQLERANKRTFKKIAGIKQEIALIEIPNTPTNEMFPGQLDVDMTKARPQGPVNDIPRMLPPRVELETNSSESSSTEEINIKAATGLLPSGNVTRALKMRLDKQGAPISHWEARADRLKKLFQGVEDDLSLTRNTLLGSDEQRAFLLKELFAYYQT